MYRNVLRALTLVILSVAVVAGFAMAQGGAAAGGQAQGAGQGRGGAGGGRGQRGPSLTVTSSAWPDGDVIPGKFSFAGGSTSPGFDFKWLTGTADAMPPANLTAYAVIFHDIENSSARGTVDTLHWMAWDFPGTLTNIPEGLGMGDLADGTKQSTTAIGRGRYFGPGAGPGPYHHYVFEFYALDTKLNLPNTATRAEVLAAMEGHVIGKAAYTGRFHQ
jgi:Raf kinase inhibitor-like YbhB/YbcL family protein